jgi:hypothetical protein
MLAHRIPTAAALAACVAFWTVVAHASDQWQQAAGGTSAILPTPLKTMSITGGSLSCAEQRWTLLLRAEAAGEGAVPGVEAIITIDGESIPVSAKQSADEIAIPFPIEALDLLKGGSRLGVSTGGPEPISASFSLKGSRAVLDAVAPRCSAIDMSGYERVALVENGPAADTARPLLAEEAALFASATEKEATLAAALIPLDGGKRLLFASLCGSTRYYGETGCKLIGYAAEAAGDWRTVYDSEGMLLYRDPNGSRDGWPSLATVPMVNGVEALTWSWDGEAYALQDPAIAEETVLELRGSASQ